MGIWRPRESRWLPDQRYWLADPFSPSNRIESSVDERGVVQPDATNAAVLTLLDPSYRGSRKVNLNDYVFPESEYKGRFIGSLSLVRYRNLPPNTRYLPIDIHNLFTIVVEAPAMPEPEVMSYSIEAWRVARNLFLKAAKIKEAERLVQARENDIRLFPGLVARNPSKIDLDREYLTDAYNHQFSRFDDFLEDYASLPDEFRPADIDLNADPRELAGNIVTTLGTIITPQTVRPPALAQAA